MSTLTSSSAPSGALDPDHRPPAGSTASQRRGTWFAPFWRWHFYAGLLVLPFLVLLAVTGGIYLFRQELDPIIHRDLMRVEARATPPRAPPRSPPT